MQDKSEMTNKKISYKKKKTLMMLQTDPDQVPMLPSYLSM